MFKEDQNTGKYKLESFEPQRIKINGSWITHSIMVSPSDLLPLEKDFFEDLTLDDLAPLFIWQPEIVLLGTGTKPHLPSQALLHAFLEKGIGIECMTSLAACRTFTVLASEDRHVAAVILIK